jgi:hypothetical protein
MVQSPITIPDSAAAKSKIPTYAAERCRAIEAIAPTYRATATVAVMNTKYTAVAAITRMWNTSW